MARACRIALLAALIVGPFTWSRGQAPEVELPTPAPSARQKLDGMEGMLEAQVIVVGRNAKAFDGETLIRPLELGEVFVVKKLGASHLLGDASVGGWVDARDVIPLRSAPERLTEAIKKTPSAENYYVRGLAWEGKKELPIAVKDYTQAIELEDGADYRCARGKALFKEGRVDAAMEDFNKAIEIDPTHAPSFNGRAAVWNKQGKYGQAVEDCSEAIRHRPDDANGYYGRSLARMGEADYGKAMADATEALERHERLAGAYLIRSRCFLALGDPKRAMVDIAEALAIDRQNPDAYLWRGHAHYKLGDVQEELADYERCVQIDPGHAEGVNAIAWVLATDADPENRNGTKAVELAKKACALANGKNAVFQETLAAAYAGTGEFTYAIASQLTAIKLIEATAGENSELTESFEQRQRFYRTQLPFRRRDYSNPFERLPPQTQEDEPLVDPFAELPE